MPPRRPLSRAAVLAAAMRLADQEGLAAVSMRRLSEELGVVPMAIYKHLADKEDLLNGMVDEAIQQWYPAPQAGPLPWKSALRERILAARQVVQEHPWLRPAIETRTTRTAPVLGYMEDLSSLLHQGGCSFDLTHHAMHALGNRIWGFSPELFDESSSPARANRAPPPQLDPADFPTILGIAADAQRRRPNAKSCDEEFEFRFAVNLLLDGIERLQAEAWTSRPD